MTATRKSVSRSWLVVVVLAFGCIGDTGPNGPAGPPGGSGGNGEDGSDGSDGQDGNDGNDGVSPWLVGPGLKIEVLDAAISTSGTATVTYRITDSAGTPLDLDGVFTRGAVSPSFILAYLDEAGGKALQYTAYTTRDQTSPITEQTATQASTDSGGNNMEMGLGEGIYTYEFGADAAGADTSLTHTVGIYASRDYEGKRYVANATYDFVPDGSDVSVTRDIVTLEACNSCHNRLGIHGDRRRDIKLCILCHSPQTTDPDTGNTVDMVEMTHKIHMGAELPSVKGGDDYQIIGHDQRVHSYGTVEFPHSVGSCETCHQGSDGDRWKNQPTRAVCGDCHDRTAFENPVPDGWTPHGGGQHPNDNFCANNGCHTPVIGQYSVTAVHSYPAIDPAAPDFVVTIDEIRNTTPGALPEVDITVTVDGSGLDILATPLRRLRFTIAGPTTDYQEYFQVVAQNNGANDVGTLVAIGDGSDGKFTYTFPAGSVIPVYAEGSGGLSIEARYRTGGGVDINAFNPVAYFPITDDPVVPRRQIVDVVGCNACHQQLEGHGGSRLNSEYCAFCHIPDNANDARRSKVEGTTVLAESVDFKTMIHGIHRGEDHARPYVLGGHPEPDVVDPVGNQIDFAELRFPGDLRDCGTCHVNDSFELPLADTVRPSRSEILECVEDPAADGDDFCNAISVTPVYEPPTRAVCTSCHDSTSSEAHAELMTTSSGLESCETCHGPGSSFDMAAAHRLDP